MTRPMHQDAAAAAVLRRTMVLLLLLLMFSLSLFSSVTAECPDKCRCWVEDVSCFNQELDRIPDRIPPATTLLDLRYSQIIDIERLDHLTELKTLMLSYNNLSELKNGTFSNLSKLQTLDLSFNEIRDIESLDHLTELQSLDLSYNKIRDIESLAHLTELQYLNLNHNKISELKNGAFSNLSKLQKLFLDENKIENIETGVFNNLTSLKELYLNYNKIHKLDLAMFKGPAKLDKLYLHENMISNIPPGIFDSLTSLSLLTLNNNNISEMKNSALSNLSKLQTLDLSYNEIRDIEPKSFTHLTELDTLKLYDNNISELKNSAFSNLLKLQLLFLHQNKIENIETGVFNNLTSLKELRLDGNKIHKLDLEMFKGLTKLNDLYLNNNMIRNIPPGIFDSLTSLFFLGLAHNPLTCDCNILLLVNVLKKNYPLRDVLGKYNGDPSCHFPVEMREKSLKEITENDLNCTSPDVIVVPENKTVSVGEQLQLSCKVVGDPEPFITWAKDDIDLELGQRFQVLQNNTLIISKVERTDGGQYKCVASNSFGRKSFEAMVNVNVLRTPKPGLHIPFTMQNQKEKTKSRRCEKYVKYEYKKSSYAKIYEVLQLLRHDGVFCDIRLKADDEKIVVAHKVILAAASPYFYEMFTKFSEKNHELVVMREIDSTALLLLVNFIYSGKIVVTEDNVQVLLPASNLLQLQKIKEMCCDFLQSQLYPTNCIGINTLADLHSCKELLTSSELYIEQHFSEVVDGDEFLSLSADQVIQLISSDTLKVPSEENVDKLILIIVIFCVIRWVKYESGSRKCILPQLMEHVRLPLTSKNYILKKVAREPLILNCFKCKDYISEALNFHKILKSEELIPQNIRYISRHGDKVILVVSEFDTNLCISTNFFEPKISRWHNGPEMITEQFHFSPPGLAVVKDNLVFAVGGLGRDNDLPLCSVDVLDLSSESLCWKSSVDMLVERDTLGVGVINNDLYAVGGHNYIDLELDSAEVFDNKTQEWRMISSMSTRRSYPGVGVLNNLLYAVGGRSESSFSLDTVECYDPSLDKWTPVTNMCVHRERAGVGVLVGVLYAVGGIVGCYYLSSVETYRPNTGVWTTIADMNYARCNAGVVEFDGLLYVFGGQVNKSDIENCTECYSPKTNTWTIVAPSRIHEHASARAVAINWPRHLKTY